MEHIYLSIIIPAYKESKRIGATLESLNEYLGGKSYGYEIIVVNDGSPDNTAEVVSSYIPKIKNLRLIDNKVNMGKGYAVKTGMLAARGDYRLFMDADNSVKITELDFFIEEITASESDIAIGSIALDKTRVVEKSGSHRRLFGAIAKAIIHTFSRTGVKDTQRGFKIFNAKSAETVFPLQTINRFGFDIELLVVARIKGFKVIELPVQWDNPEGSTVTLKDYGRTFVELFNITKNNIFGKYGKKVTTSEVVPFDEEKQKRKGKGFMYKGKEFIHHTNLHNSETAFYNLLADQKVLLGLLVAVLLVALIINWHVTLIVLFCAMTIVYFLDLLFNGYIIYLSHISTLEIVVNKKETEGLKEDMLPMYTIFCPLYKEWQVVPQFVEAMNKLDYPTNKLQIIFLLEENDKETVEKISHEKLPAHYEIVVVPHSNPKTKPKAMNYGLKHVRGEYLVIYDAEDIPESDQLKKAVVAFSRVSKKTICIQAKLSFYNIEQNILTRLFTGEYSMWFDLVLPGLQALKAPIPLGGTSNHFKVDVLKELSGWDAFNVTEDCDLGMRLAKKGWRTAIVDSTTYEEANSKVFNWYNQRSRWIKGYIQTFFVHNRNPREFIEEGSLKDLLIFQLNVGGKIASMFINPIMWVMTILYFMFRAHIGLFIETFFPGPILYIGVFSFIFGNALYLYYYMIGCAKRGYDGIIKYVVFVPFYWLGMSFAAWKAVYEIIVKPHYWSKTVHGLHLAKTAPTKNTEQAIEQSSETLPTAPVFGPSDPAPALETIMALEQAIPNKKKSFFTGKFSNLFSSGSLLVASFIAGNFINFLFSSYLGRKLDADDFGVVTVVNALMYLLTIFISAFSSTLTHKIAFLRGKREPAEAVRFFRRVRFSMTVVTFILSAVWIMLSPQIAEFFHIGNVLVISLLAPTVMFGVLEGINNGFLQGSLSFAALGIATLAEALSKLAIAIGLVHSGMQDYVALSIPASLGIAYFLSACFTLVTMYKDEKSLDASRVVSQKKKPDTFPYIFYFAAIFNSLSTMAFLSLDVVLVKHYFSPTIAGEYGLLSLVGKMIFFSGTLLNTFIIALVSRDIGKGINPSKTFHKIFIGMFALTGAAWVVFGVFGYITVPILLGTHALIIIPYLPIYTFAIALFCITTGLMTYHLAKKHYVFSIAGIVAALSLIIGMAFADKNIKDLTELILGINIGYLALVTIMHLVYGSIRIIFNNLLDILKVFIPLIPAPKRTDGGKRLLIFNWRDTKHSYAGGAELYVEEMAKHWTATGNSVTVFCGNDGKTTGDEIVNGVRIIRRGGFYIVYLCAFLYYLVHFRGEFDVIVDCENGVPFFTPLFAKEPVFCLVHHVHQEVFTKYLGPALALVARFMERVAMPLVYKNTPFITVSESSKKDMVDVLKIPSTSIHVISPGISLDLDGITIKKSKTPLITYVGRLKSYKSIDVLIKAFSIMLEKNPDAELIIAGDGDDQKRLMSYTDELNLGEKVTFAGKISEEEKVKLLTSAWIFVNPSSMEGWGITTIEANACGTPTIASDVPGLRDSVQNGVTGLLVPYGDAHALAYAMNTVIGNKVIRKKFGVNSIEWANNFNWEDVAHQFLSVVAHDISSKSIKDFSNLPIDIRPN